MIENKNEHVDKELFEFVQRDEKIYDKKFETKPIGYFKDAMIRFRKNKTNVTATVILFILIFLSIIVPMLTTKNYTRLEEKLIYLPPRVPLVEKLGILDGHTNYENQTVDRSTIDPETGLGYPTGINPEYIVEGTLENYKQTCGDKNAQCVGGINLITPKKEGTPAVVQTKTIFNLNFADNPVFTIDVKEFTGNNPKLDVLVSLDIGTTYTVAKTITAPGVYEIDIFEGVNDNHDQVSRIRLSLSAENSENTSVSLNSVKLVDDAHVEPLLDVTGFALSDSFNTAEDNSNWLRRGGEYIKSNFEYDLYGAAFGLTNEKIGNDEYDEIMEEYSDVCQSTPDPDNPEQGLLFPEKCPIQKVISVSEKMLGPDGKYHFTYETIIDYKIYADYDEIPYFLFGTDQAGRDYFASVWLGLRTSLFVGLVVATINIAIGIVYGAIEGYYGGRVDLLMERFAEIIGRIPFLVWLSLFVILLGPGIVTLIVLLTVTGWLGVASVTRTQFYRYKGREYVLASRTLGAKDSRIIFRHILPNGIGTIITQSILMIPFVIFSESTVSYLGYGIGHGQSFKLLGLFELSGVSIGVLLSDGREQIVDRPYLIFFPAIIISILMITFNMFGNALRDAFNPSLRGSE